MGIEHKNASYKQENLGHLPLNPTYVRQYSDF